MDSNHSKTAVPAGDLAKEFERKWKAAQKRAEAEQKRLEAAQKRLEAAEKRAEAEQKRLEEEQKRAEAAQKRLEALEEEQKGLKEEQKRLKEEQKRLEEAQKRADKLADENLVINRANKLAEEKLVADEKRLNPQRWIEDGLPELKLFGNPKPHVHDNDGANIISDKEFISDAVIKAFEPPRIKGLLSSLITEVKIDRTTKGECLRAYNEISVQCLVSSALKDAIKILDLDAELQCFMEMSMFSLRPDIIVVSHPTLGVLLIVKVKNPSISDINVFESEEIAREMYDYLKVMERTGHTTPFVVVTTFEELVVARLKDNEKEYAEVVEASTASLKGDNFHPFHEIKDKEKKAGTSPSGNKLRRNFCDSTEETMVVPPVMSVAEDEQDETTDDNEDDGTGRPDLVYSKVFGRKDIMKVVIHAIVCGMKSLDTMSRSSDEGTLLPVEGQVMERAMPSVYEKGFKWKNLKEPVTYTEHPSKQSKCFSLISTIGIGNTSKVFLGCNTAGKALALKFYLLDTRYLGTFDKREREEERKQVLKQSKQRATDEVERWTFLYSEGYGQMVSLVELNQMFVVAMPYLPSIPKRYRHEIHVLKAVARILEKFAKKKYVYRVACWGHVGCRLRSDGTLEVVLLDLMSLKVIPPQGFDVQKYIERHLTALIGCSGIPLGNSDQDDLVRKALDEDEDSDEDNGLCVMTSASNIVNSSLAGLNSEKNAHVDAQVNISPSVSKGSTTKRKLPPPTSGGSYNR